MNPLLSIWRKPTKTIEYILEEKTIAYGFFIFFLGAISTGVTAMEGTGFLTGMPIALIIFLSVIIAYSGALIGWVLAGAMYTWVGKWLGGTGDFSDMMRVVPAGTLPMIWLAPLNFLLVAMYGARLFEEPLDNFGVTNMSLGVYFLVNLITIGVGIFGTVVSCKAIGLVHHFSAWRGLGVVAIVAGIGIAIAVIIIIFLFVVLFSMFGM